MNVQPRPVTQRRIEDFVTLRTLVAYLGERDQFNWWDCSFLNGTGRKFLAINYPKTALAAAVHAASDAACRMHDARIGKGRVFHLFRLPAMMERKIHRRALELGATEGALWLENKEAAMGQLEKLATKPASVPTGPIKAGAIAALSAPATIGTLAGFYSNAFKSEQQTLPYFGDSST